MPRAAVLATIFTETGIHMGNVGYEMSAKEIADGSVKAGLWTRLFAEASGDENRTKALYIARRAEMLMAERQSVRDQEAARIDETRRQDAERRKKEPFFAP